MFPRTPKFHDELLLLKSGECTWVVEAPLRFYSARLGRTVKVPAGFVTDLASIPRGLWNIFPKVGKQDRASVVHDCGYSGSLIDALGNPILLKKEQIDFLFYEGMQADGVGKVSAWLMWRAVKLFGRTHFGVERAV